MFPAAPTVLGPSPMGGNARPPSHAPKDLKQQRRVSMEHQNHSDRSGPLYTEKVLSDRKIFFLDLKENNRGRFIKITEDVRGRRDTIIVPVEALDEFMEALSRVADEARELEDD